MITITVLLALLLRVFPEDALRDAPIRVQIHAQRLQRVNISLRERDALGHEWRSSLKRRADVQGNISLNDPMQLFWSAVPSRKIRAPFSWPKNLQPVFGSIDVRIDGRIVAGKRIIRRQIAPRVRISAVRADGLVGELFIPQENGPRPAVVVLGGSEGGYPRDLPALLASRGIAAISIAYFGVSGLPKDLVGVPIETVRNAAAYLGTQPGVSKDSIGIVGISRGGELALLCASYFPSIHAAIGIVPSPVVEAGLRFGTGPVDASPWTYEGKPLPFATFAQLQQFLQGGDVSSIASAMIPLRNINGPFAVIAGGDDQLGFSGALFRRAFSLQPRRSGDVFLNYASAGHLIDMPYTPTANLSELQTPYGVLHFGGTARGYAFADADSWPRILRFLTAAPRTR